MARFAMQNTSLNTPRKKRTFNYLILLGKKFHFSDFINAVREKIKLEKDIELRVNGEKCFYDNRKISSSANVIYISFSSVELYLRLVMYVLYVFYDSL